jgi:hypothetical protein
MYCCYENVDIFANITILIVIYLVEGGFLALDKITDPAAEVSLLNNEVYLTIYEILPLFAGTLSVHAPLQISVTLDVIKLD